MAEFLTEGPWVCRECWEFEGNCGCEEPQYAPTYFKEDHL